MSSIARTNSSALQQITSACRREEKEAGHVRPSPVSLSSHLPALSWKEAAVAALLPKQGPRVASSFLPLNQAGTEKTSVRQNWATDVTTGAAQSNTQKSYMWMQPYCPYGRRELSCNLLTMMYPLAQWHINQVQRIFLLLSCTLVIGPLSKFVDCNSKMCQDRSWITGGSCYKISETELSFTKQERIDFQRREKFWPLQTHLFVLFSVTSREWREGGVQWRQSPL